MSLEYVDKTLAITIITLEFYCLGSRKLLNVVKFLLFTQKKNENIESHFESQLSLKKS